MPSSATVDRALVSVKILVDGAPIKSDMDVLDITVTKELNRIGAATIQFIDGSAAKESFALSSSNDFIPGKSIEIQAGYDLATQKIFKGMITAQSIHASNESGYMLYVECKDQAVKMTVGQKNGTFNKSKDSDAISALISNNGLSAEVKATSDTYPQIVQYYTSDWDFMLSRAEASGMVVLTDDAAVKVAPPKVDGAPVMMATFGDNIFEMDLKMDARFQLQDVQAQSWDFKTQAPVESKAQKPSVPEQGNLSGSKLGGVVSPAVVQLQTTAPLESAALTTWASAALLKSRLAKIRGNIKLFGDSTLAPNTLISLSGLGDRFNGDAYISKVKHTISNGNWWSVVSVGLDPIGFVQSVEVTALPASGLLPGIRGLQNGVVKQIDQDPAGEFMIQVSIPVFKSASGDSLVWARWAQPYATQKAGQFFMPEINDEVIVGFLNDDPRFPVVIGSLYSSQNHAPAYQPQADNPIKAIVTKNQLVIELSDKDKIITVKTPNGNQIQFSDKDQAISLKDQNGNEATFNSSGIAIKSAAAINISAPGKVTISGDGGVAISSSANVDISAQGNLSESGLEVSISAQTTLSASGQAQTSISASGELSLRGAMVMIN